MKIGKWRVEYTITLLVVYTLILLAIPTSLKSTVQAGHITKWKYTFDKMTYVQDAILKQEQSQILTSFNRAKDVNEREDLIIRIIKPYFRLKEVKVPKSYKVKYMNKNKISKQDIYNIDDYYFTDNNMIVGIKDTPELDSDINTMFIMTFDINGLLPPNVWGKDVFGVRVYSDRVEPIGKDLTIEKQYYDCSAHGSGTGCSNYYLIGGDFSD